MITRKFKFSIATNYINSECSEDVVLHFDDDATEQQIEDEANQIYTEWLFENNHGSLTEIKD